jgi:hypothetical protein
MVPLVRALARSQVLSLEHGRTDEVMDAEK